MSIKKQLLIIPVVALIGVLSSAWWSDFSLRKVMVNSEIYNTIISAKDLAADIQPPPEFIIESLLLVHRIDGTTDEKKMMELLNRLETVKRDFYLRQKYWSESKLPEHLKMQVAGDLFLFANKFYEEVSNQFLPAVHSRNKAAALASIDTLEKLFDQHRDSVEVMIVNIQKYQETQESVAAKLVMQSLYGNLSILLCAISVILIFTLLITRKILRTLGAEPREILNWIRQIKKGNFALDAETNSRPGSLQAELQNMTSHLAGIIREIRVMAEQVATFSKQQRDAAGKMAISARYQAEAEVQVSNGLSEISRSLTQCNSQSSQTTSIAARSVDLAEKGADASLMTVEAIQSITQKITQIHDIANQTTYLAMNAAISAARTQEEGEGFAIIAFEIRKLADVTREAAREIEAISQACEQDVVRSHAFMGQLSESVQQSSTMVHEVSQKLDRDNSALVSISQTLSEIATVTAGDAHAVEELASAAQSLNDMVHQTLGKISQFKIKNESD